MSRAARWLDRWGVLLAFLVVSGVFAWATTLDDPNPVKSTTPPTTPTTTVPTPTTSAAPVVIPAPVVIVRPAPTPATTAPPTTTTQPCLLWSQPPFPLRCITAP